MRPVRRTTAGVALLVLGLFTLGAAPKAPSGPPITIGAILSITGNYAPLGEPERNALLLAEKDINAHGGIAGRPVQFTIVDDEGKADTAQQLATQLAGQKVAALIASSLSPTSTAVARVANENKIVQIYMTPTQQIWNTSRGVLKYTFEATPRNELEAEKLLSFIKTKLGGSKVALLHDEAQYGTVGAAVVEAEAKILGVDIVDDDSFAINATDLTPQLQKAKAAEADTILIWTASPAAALLVRQTRQLGLKVNIVGSTGIVSDNFLKVSGRDGYGVYADQSLDLTHPTAEQSAFITAYRETYHARANNFGSFAWDAAHLAAWALDRTKGDQDGDAVANALESMKPLRGSTGVHAFTATDHNGMQARDIRIVIEHGAWETLAAQ